MSSTKEELPVEITTALNTSKKVILITAKSLENRNGPAASQPPPEGLAVLFKQLLSSLRYTTTSLSLAFKPPITTAAVIQQLTKFTDEVCRTVSFVVAAANGAGLSSTLLLMEWTAGVLDVINEAQRYIDTISTGDYLQLTGMVWSAVDKMAEMSTKESEALKKRWAEDTATIKDAWSELQDMLSEEPNMMDALDDEVFSPEEKAEAERVSLMNADDLIAGQADPRPLPDPPGYFTSGICFTGRSLVERDAADIKPF